MIRRSLLNINYANQNKLANLDYLCGEMMVVINLFIKKLWDDEEFSAKFVTFKVDTWLSARLQQCLGKQALEIVKSQRKKKPDKRTRPTFTGRAFSLDGRFVDFKYEANRFDIWVRLTSLGDSLNIKLPSKAHGHYNKYKQWDRSKSIRLLRRENGEYFIEVFFRKESPKLKVTGKTVGVDIGYKKLLVSSENKVYDDGLEKVYEKIERKKQHSKAFKRSLVERNNLINQSLNKLGLRGVRELVCEDLKGIKQNVRKKRTISKKFNNKLQRWSYAKVLSKITSLTDEQGVLLTKVNPAYTSQKCSNCGVICKSNRKGETYKCTCGIIMDSDYNGAINVSHMGVYSPHILYCNVC